MFMFSALLGCSTSSHRDGERCEVDSAPNVTLTQLNTEGSATTYRLKSNEDCPLTYFHWAGQGPEPVPYCKTENGEISVCSPMVFVDGSDETGYDYWTHETVLGSNATVTFLALDEKAVEVGVQFWSYSKGSEIYKWTTVRK